MSCSGYFDDLLRNAEKQSFKKRILPDIQQLKDRLARKLVSLRVKGDFRKTQDEINGVKATLDYLEKTEKTIKRLVEV